MYLDLNDQLFFIDNIRDILSSQCVGRVILSPTIWQTNLNARNWMVGNQTLDDVIEQYYQRAITYDNITNCDLRTPYFSNGSCIDCPAETPIFNLRSAQCMKCNIGDVFDSSKRVCVQLQDSLVMPSAAGCPNGTIFDGRSGSCIRSINCKENEFFNGTTKACQEYVQCG